MADTENGGLDDAKITWPDKPKRRRHPVAIIAAAIVVVGLVAFIGSYRDAFDLSDHRLTTIGTWAEVAILVWMVWERFNPKPEASVKPLEYVVHKKQLIDYFVENRTLIFAAIGLAVVVWLNFREQSVPASFQGFTQQQVDQKIAAATAPLTTRIQSLQTSLDNASRTPPISVGTDFLKDIQIVYIPGHPAALQMQATAMVTAHSLDIAVKDEPTGRRFPLGEIIDLHAKEPIEPKTIIQEAEGEMWWGNPANKHNIPGVSPGAAMHGTYSFHICFIIRDLTHPDEQEQHYYLTLTRVLENAKENIFRTPGDYPYWAREWETQ